MQLLIGHVSPETAFVVDDYPYGFRLRCKIRYWLDFSRTHGFRLMSQTTNPKRPGETWNKPKASTYCRFGGAMYLNEEGHVKWTGLTEYCTAAEAIAFRDTFGEAMPLVGWSTLETWIKMKLAYEKKLASIPPVASI